MTRIGSPRSSPFRRSARESPFASGSPSAREHPPSPDGPPSGEDDSARELEPEITVGIREVLGTFGALLRRDLTVTVRAPWSFLAQSLVQPFFMLFIFGKVLGEIGIVHGGFGAILLPGIVSLNAFLVALQNTALPLVMDFAHTREIDDRLLAPISIAGVALEKILFGAFRGFISAVLMIPVGLLMLSGVVWPFPLLGPALLILAMGSALGATIGLFVGTLVPPKHVSVTFTVAVTPLMFTGSIQFPWASLHDIIWFQFVCAINPLTYLSEGMRALLLGPQLPSIPLWTDLPLIAVGVVVFGALSIGRFIRRALD